MRYCKNKINECLKKLNIYQRLVIVLRIPQSEAECRHIIEQQRNSTVGVLLNCVQYITDFQCLLEEIILHDKLW